LYISKGYDKTACTIHVHLWGVWQGFFEGLSSAKLHQKKNWLKKGKKL